MTISKIEKIEITRHLGVMIRSGIPIAETLSNLSKSAKSSNAKKILGTISDDINNGSSLTKAFSRYPRVFDDFYLGIIEVGEKTGKLDSSLEYLSGQLSKDFSMEKKIRGALMYPMLVLGATFFLTIFISVFILPRLTEFFAAFDQDLPLATRILLTMSSFSSKYGIISLIILSGFIFLLSLFIRLPKIHFIVDKVLLRIPLFGHLISQREIARFSRNFSVLLRSGLPVLQALQITAKAQTNLVYKKLIDSIYASLNKGNNISSELKQKNVEFLMPQFVTQMIEVGEKTGTLDQSLNYVAEFYDEEIEDTSKNFANILEPVILLFIGLVVAFIAIAIISPIYQLTGSLG